MTRMTKETTLEARARQMMARFRTHEWLGFAAGFLILAAVEVVRAWYAPQLPARMVYGCFVPIVGAVSLLAIYLSVSLHKALKEHSACTFPSARTTYSADDPGQVSTWSRQAISITPRLSSR
jgi:hypothetical protein